MKLFSLIKPKDNVTIEVRDALTDKLLKKITTHNLVVTAGRDLIRDFLYDGSTVTVDGLTHFAVGTNATAEVAANTTLGTETARELITQKTKNSAQLTVKYYLGSGVANGVTLAECGLFNAASAGTMYARATYTGIAKTASITITYTWILTWSV
jgi:hypothetical protein